MVRLIIGHVSPPARGPAPTWSKGRLTPNSSLVGNIIHFMSGSFGGGFAAGAVDGGAFNPGEGFGMGREGSRSCFLSSFSWALSLAPTRGSLLRPVPPSHVHNVKSETLEA